MNVPIVTEGNSLLISSTTYDDKIGKVWEELQRSGQSEIVGISTLQSGNPDNMLMLLTERQREIVFYAVEKGYYEVPRKINTNDLAKRFDISQSALSEHLRKIERIIFRSLFKS